MFSRTKNVSWHMTLHSNELFFNKSSILHITLLIAMTLISYPVEVHDCHIRKSPMIVLVKVVLNWARGEPWHKSRGKASGWT
jgi:hypothetical protein